jgi:adenylate cyclase
MRVEAETILAINPNDATALGVVGTGLIYAGEPDYGRQFVEKAISLVGPAAEKFWWGAIADYYYTKGEYAKALEVFRLYRVVLGGPHEAHCCPSASGARRGGSG